MPVRETYKEEFPPGLKWTKTRPRESGGDKAKTVIDFTNPSWIDDF
jgi:hypothetical protein